LQDVEDAKEDPCVLENIFSLAEGSKYSEVDIQEGDQQ
jgi:hypothetical protein